MRGVFTEDWFSAKSCNELNRLVRTVAHLDGAIIEVGCWEGRSTCSLANGAHPETVIAVDTWEGSPGEISAELAVGRDVYGTFLHNVRALTHGNVKPYRMGWRDYFAQHHGAVKFCHIDAEHTYVEVAENIEAVLPHMIPGGVICGDDAHHEPVRQAVLDTLGGDVYVTASLWVWRAP